MFRSSCNAARAGLPFGETLVPTALLPWQLDCAATKQRFIAELHYVALSTKDSYAALHAVITVRVGAGCARARSQMSLLMAETHPLQATNPEEAGRVFYLSIAPSLFASVGAAIASSARPANPHAWLRYVLEPGTRHSQCGW